MKRRLTAVCVLTGLVWSCVSPLPVDSEGTESGGSSNQGATAGSGVAGSTSAGSGGSETVGSGGTSTAGGPSSSDSFCPFDDELEYDPAAAYPFCHGDEQIVFGLPDPSDSTDTIVERCRGKAPGVPEGAGRHAWTSTDGSPDGEPLNFCSCTIECEVDADCPAGDSGDAVPTCIDFFCHLGCDHDETCPNGMLCTGKPDPEEGSSEQRVCMWPSRGDGCDSTDWPNVTQPEAPIEEDAICPFDGELEYDPNAAYPFCEGNEIISFDPPDPASPVDAIQERCRPKSAGSVEGAGRHAWTSTDGSPDGKPLNFCSCTIGCEVDTDCPAGDTGDAAPTCIDFFCHLGCDNDEACPDGMTCTEKPNPEGGPSEQRVCMWGTRASGCDTSEWPNVSEPE